MSQAFEIEVAIDSGIRPKAAHELTSRHVEGPVNLSYTSHDDKNYLQVRCKGSWHTVRQKVY
jgi:hypothetical protein